ncbi:hypothetical protein Tco_0483064, partial [Tanacetum coccineum]
CDAEEMRCKFKIESESMICLQKNHKADDNKDKECSQEVLGYNPQKLNQKKLEVNK